MTALLILVGIFGSLWPAAKAAAADLMHHWVQLGPGSEVVVRAVTRATTCPALQVDGTAVSMTRRAATARYPAQVCERRLPRSSRQIMLDSQTLPVLKADVRRIAVIGDTGCRIKRQHAQACNDPRAWPLGAIVEAIAEQQPDLVIHVGDYLYREAPCPSSVDCQGSPHGYNWPVWAADWFGPAQPLLSRVPFLFLRGNHEECGRAWEGWFRYLAAEPVPSACIDVSKPWKTQVAGIGLIVFDSADGPSPYSSPRLLESDRRLATKMFADLNGPSWFLTHRPLWAYLHAFGDLITGDSTQRAAFGATLPKELGVILSGHIHAFQALDLAGGPVQLIAGNGGTRLDPMPTRSQRDVDVAGQLARTIVSDAGFGFLQIDRMGSGRWRIEARDAQSAVRRRCTLSGDGFNCEGAR
jgi:hypothetical protein